MQSPDVHMEVLHFQLKIIVLLFLLEEYNLLVLTCSVACHLDSQRMTDLLLLQFSFYFRTVLQSLHHSVVLHLFLYLLHGYVVSNTILHTVYFVSFI